MGYSEDEYQWFVDSGHAGTTFQNADRDAGLR
jgi:hypothetical protein